MAEMRRQVGLARRHGAYVGWCCGVVLLHELYSCMGHTSGGVGVWFCYTNCNKFDNDGGNLRRGRQGVGLRTGWPGTGVLGCNGKDVVLAGT